MKEDTETIEKEPTDRHMLGVYITVKDRDDLSKIAQKYDRSMSNLVKLWIRDGIKKYNLGGE